ncbi:MAG TPA: alpha/beta fold hydrolase [Stellaceae bacterium]|jgi:pimeloyl-ACP methyl ester carboxylesterase|nr:alpha/beta fold hydrolase [Stellaceae bacterium]
MLFRDELFEAQWLRTAGHAGAGGAEIGECLAVARAIRERDTASWYIAWHGLAEHVLAEAETSKAAGHRVSARGAYLRAANYFRAAYTFLFGAPVDPRLVAAYRQHRAAFAAAGALMNPAAEPVAFPYEGHALRGYFLRAAYDRVARPTVIVNGGYDSTAEECYWWSGAAALARGYNVILFDGPGQGAALIEDGLPFRPDWESVIAPVVDYARMRGEIDPARIALLGISFGGYLAPRAASGEPRLAALIADPGEYSLFEEMRSRLPLVIAREFPDGNPWILRLLEFMLKRRLRHPTKGWGLRRGLWVHGVDDPLAYLRLTADYSVKGRARDISCPSLICTAEQDEIGVTARKLYDSLTCDKRFILFTADEGAGNHCEAGARALFNQRAFDWLDEVFAR